MEQQNWKGCKLLSNWMIGQISQMKTLRWKEIVHLQWLGGSNGLSMNLDHTWRRYRASPVYFVWLHSHINDSFKNIVENAFKRIGRAVHTFTGVNVKNHFGTIKDTFNKIPLLWLKAFIETLATDENNNKNLKWLFDTMGTIKNYIIWLKSGFTSS